MISESVGGCPLVVEMAFLMRVRALRRPRLVVSRENVGVEALPYRKRAGGVWRGAVLAAATSRAPERD